MPRPLPHPEHQPAYATASASGPAGRATDLHWQRCFVALTPTRTAAEQLALPGAPGIRSVVQPSLHLTLAFIGDLPAEHGRDIATALPALAQPLAPLPLETIEWWPDAIRPRVLVATFTTPAALAEMVERLRARLAAGGLPTGNAFRAHVTLARATRRITVEQAAAALRQPRVPSTVRFAALTLYATPPDATAGQYWQVASVPLATVDRQGGSSADNQGGPGNR